MKNLRSLAVVLGAAACAVLVAAPAAPSAAGLPQMPTDPAEAAREFESDLDNWHKGPVSYLFTPDEQRIWKELRDDDEKRAFIAWFWTRRDDDTRAEGNPFFVGFYTRVAEANKRFSGFPRGWRGDRGRVWIILGRPDNIRTDIPSELEIWNYFTPGRLLAGEAIAGELEIGFARVDVGKWEIYGGIGPGVWPPYVLRTFEIINRATIQDPFLELKE